MRILVADDDAVSRSMMRRMLIQSGYEVATAADGAEAVQILLSGEPPRLVLLDWMMPELDGPEVCKAVREAPSRAYTYITLLTSKESKEDLVAGLEAGADDYLTKPCNLEELRARLRTGERVLQLEDTLLKAHEEMRFKANHDALTLLLNRGAILQCLRKSCDPGSSGFSLMLCDIDHFKRINDSYGHPVGDEVLREIARRLQGSIGKTGQVGRYGGEEFLLLLEEADSQSMTASAEGIRESIRSTPILTSAGPPQCDDQRRCPARNGNHKIANARTTPQVGRRSALRCEARWKRSYPYRPALQYSFEINREGQPASFNQAQRDLGDDGMTAA